MPQTRSSRFSPSAKRFEQSGTLLKDRCFLLFKCKTKRLAKISQRLLRVYREMTLCAVYEFFMGGSALRRVNQSHEGNPDGENDPRQVK